MNMNKKIAEALTGIEIAFFRKDFDPDTAFAKLFECQKAGEDVEEIIKNLQDGRVLTEYQRFVRDRAEVVSSLLLAQEAFITKPSDVTLSSFREAKERDLAKDFLEKNPAYLDRAQAVSLSILKVQRCVTLDGPFWRNPGSATGFLFMVINLKLTKVIVDAVKV